MPIDDGVTKSQVREGHRISVGANIWKILGEHDGVPEQHVGLTSREGALPNVEALTVLALSSKFKFTDVSSNHPSAAEHRGENRSVLVVLHELRETRDGVES